MYVNISCFFCQWSMLNGGKSHINVTNYCEIVEHPHSYIIHFKYIIEIEYGWKVFVTIFFYRSLWCVKETIFHRLYVPAIIQTTIFLAIIVFCAVVFHIYFQILRESKSTVSLSFFFLCHLQLRENRVTSFTFYIYYCSIWLSIRVVVCCGKN